MAESENTYGRSAAEGQPVPTTSALTFADGMAVRVPDAMALEVIRRGTDRIVEVSDDDIAEAIRILYSTTHCCAEGAGAAALAALIKERERLHGGRAAVIVSGQNIDREYLPCPRKSQRLAVIAARIAAFFSVELPCGTMMVTATRHGESVVIQFSVTNRRRLACGAHL